MIELKDDIKDNKGKKILTVKKFNDLVNSYAKRILEESEEEKQTSNLHIEIEITYKQLSQKYENKTIFENTDIDSIYYVMSKTCSFYYYYYRELNGKSSKERFFNLKKYDRDILGHENQIFLNKITSIEELDYFIRVFGLEFLLERHNILLKSKTNNSIMEHYFNLIINELKNKTITKKDLDDNYHNEFIKSTKFLNYLKLTNNLNLLDE